MSNNMDIDAGKILNNNATLDEIGNEIFDKIIEVAKGNESYSKSLGHQEFVLGYKTFEPVGPSCLPSH